MSLTLSQAIYRGRLLLGLPSEPTAEEWQALLLKAPQVLSDMMRENTLQEVRINLSLPGTQVGQAYQISISSSLPILAARLYYNGLNITHWRRDIADIQTLFANPGYHWAMDGGYIWLSWNASGTMELVGAKDYDPFAVVTGDTVLFDADAAQLQLIGGAFAVILMLEAVKTLLVNAVSAGDAGKEQQYAKLAALIAPDVEKQKKLLARTLAREKFGGSGRKRYVL